MPPSIVKYGFAVPPRHVRRRGAAAFCCARCGRVWSCRRVKSGFALSCRPARSCRVLPPRFVLFREVLPPCSAPYGPAAMCRKIGRRFPQRRPLSCAQTKPPLLSSAAFPLSRVEPFPLRLYPRWFCLFPCCAHCRRRSFATWKSHPKYCSP